MSKNKNKAGILNNEIRSWIGGNKGVRNIVGGYLTKLISEITYMSAIRSSRVGIPSRCADVERMLSRIPPEGFVEVSLRRTF